MSIQHFILHVPTGDFWQVDDPVAWCLAHVHDPILERAMAGLSALTLEDRDRIIRLVTRRCGLHVIQVQPGQVIVHYWLKAADLRPFFKQNALAQKTVKVFLRECSHEVVTVTSDGNYLYGVAVSEEFVKKYQNKWAHRFEDERDDWQPAPSTWSNFRWPAVDGGRVPWAVLKSAWQREQAPLCPNCDQPMIVFQFGMWRATLFNAYPRFVYFCRGCNRTIEGDPNWDVEEWLLANLDADLVPTLKRDLWGRSQPWKPGQSVY